VGGYFLPEGTIVQELFPQIFQGLIDFDDVLFPRKVLILISNEEDSLKFLNQPVYPLAILNDLDDNLAAELHLVYYLDRSYFEVVLFLVLILDC
jgi:hypothetical protein